MAQHNILGKKGEEIAVRYLKDKGYEILKQNYRHGHDEIDIVAKIIDELVIVEVKTRSSSYFGYPEEAVDLKKQKFLIRAAEAFIEEYDFDMNIRYDIISIILKNNDISIRHIEDAFYPE